MLRSCDFLRRRTAGFTAVEIVLAVLVLGVALVPMLRTMADTGREAGFSETYLLAHARVQSILDAAEGQGWISIPASTPTSELTIPLAAGQAPEELWGPAPEVYDEILVAERLEDGLVRLQARVRWMPTSLSSGRHASEAASVRILRRADFAWTRP